MKIQCKNQKFHTEGDEAVFEEAKSYLQAKGAGAGRTFAWIYEI